jgi:CubicO group peptidase (beta-lactamase class C family)
MGRGSRSLAAGAALWLVAGAAAAPSMRFPAAEWTSADPLDLGVDPVGLQHALAYWRMATGAHGIDRAVVARRGVLVHEGEEAATPQDVRSVTKSFTSTLLGLAAADRGLSLDALAADHEPLLRERYGRVTLRHLATMTSGYSAPGRSRWGEPSEDWSARPYVPGPPLFAPGERFAYWDEAQMMLGRVVTRIAGRDLLALLDERVLRPIGARADRWWAEGDVGGVPLRNGCTGLAIDARSLARYGHLFLNGGRWQGRAVVPEEWVREATRPQVPPDLPIADTDRRGIDGRGVYGFNWWTNGRGPDGRPALPHAPAGTFYAAGLGHNILLVVPEWEMVIVRLGEGGNPPEGHAAVIDTFLRKLAPAVHPLGD